ncbi:MAG: 4-hydroxy-tetrahydrodipicolinate reductase [Opitutales bacterium]
MPLRLLLNGCQGRMGQAITAAAPAADAVIASRLDAGDALTAAAATGVDVALDFSTHTATGPLAAFLAAHRIPLVIGTTGHTPAERAAILAHTRQIPIVWAGNYSVGVNLLNFLVRFAATTLGPRFQPEIIEMHHRDKVDAPSGTALKLVEIIRDVRSLAHEKVIHGRHGLTGARPDDQIGVHSLRGGDVVGDHTVIFAGDGERVEISHHASNRSIFAIGALRAARWAVGRLPGLYAMEDVLDLNR